jgi:hypothetical protein
MNSTENPEHIAIYAAHWGVDYDIAEAFCTVGWHHRDLITFMYEDSSTADGNADALPGLKDAGLVVSSGRVISLTEKGERYAVQMLGAIRTEAPRQMELFA